MSSSNKLLFYSILLRYCLQQIAAGVSLLRLIVVLIDKEPDQIACAQSRAECGVKLSKILNRDSECEKFPWDLKIAKLKAEIEEYYKLKVELKNWLTKKT